MSEQLNEATQKKMKHMFLIFLKQFQVNEYRYLMIFLQSVINKYNVSPSKLFSFLTTQEDILKNQVEEKNKQTVKEEETEKEHSNLSADDDLNYGRKFSLKLNPVLNKRRPKLTLAKLNGSFTNEGEQLLNKNKTPILLNTNRLNSGYKNMPESKSEKQQLASSLSSVDSNSESSCLSKDYSNNQFINSDCIEHNITSEQENDETEIDYSDENYEQNSFSKHPLEIDMLANRSEIIDSFLLKDTDSIDEISLKNEDENEETFVEDNASRKYWERFDPKLQQSDEYQEEITDQLCKLKSDLNQSFNSGSLDQSLPEPKIRIRKFSEEIRNELEAAFLAKNFISGFEKAELSKRLNLTERQVQKWFVHRREKLRRLEKKSATLNSTLDHHHSQIRSVQSSSNYQNITMDSRPKLIPQIRMLKKENPYQKVYDHSYREKKFENMPTICKTENSENNYEYAETEEVDDYFQSDEPDNLNEREYLNDNIWNNDNNCRNNENNLEENSNEANPSYSAEDNQSYLNDDNQNCLADETNYFLNNEDNNEYNQENSAYLNDFENSVPNEMNFEAYDETSENFDESLDSKTEQSSMNCHKYHLDGLNVTSFIKQPSTTKGTRRLFPPEVITHLEKVFDTEKYLKENQVEEIAKVTKLSEKQIRSWFKQRRYRYNQENKQNGTDSDMVYKKRDSLSQSVIVELEKAFLVNNYIFGENKKALSRQLNLKPNQLERWFYYRRKREPSVTPTGFDFNQTF